MFKSEYLNRVYEGVEKRSPGEKEFLGRGVSYCAIVDAAKYKGKTVAAIATVPDALEEIEYLACPARP